MTIEYLDPIAELLARGLIRHDELFYSAQFTDIPGLAPGEYVQVTVKRVRPTQDGVYSPWVVAGAEV